MTLNLVVDNSGSMIEGGRRFIERTVVRQFGRYLRTGKISAEVRLYLLSDNLVETAWKPDEDVPAALLFPSGHLNVETLMSAPSLMEGKTVLISDSCLSTEEDQKLQEWMARQTTEKVVVVRIGEDALTSRVAEGVFAVEQIEGLLSVL
jgi:hypothetical protein